MKATAKDLRFHTKEVLENIARGEEVIITYRGKPLAKMIPINTDTTSNIKNPLKGIWKDHNESSNVSSYVKKMRKARTF